MVLILIVIFLKKTDYKKFLIFDAGYAAIKVKRDRNKMLNSYSSDLHILNNLVEIEIY